MEAGRFLVSSWTAPANEPPAGWPSIFRVHAGSESAPAILGAYEVDGGKLSFRPRFSLAPGLRVFVVFAPPGLSAIKATFDVPGIQSKPSTDVVQVFPTGDELPENQLKFYIEFSAPMQRGTAWDYIRLLKEDGTAVELPFIEFDEELWDPSGRRLTILFDPGRIKRGVLPLEEVGPALEEGRKYMLAVDSHWRDARGQPLRAGFKKHFRVTAADRDPIDPQRWTIVAPAPNTTAPLRVVLHEPLDYALLGRMLNVAGPDGEFAGTATVSAGENEWHFTPAAPWKAAQYNLRIDTALEDLAGNKVGRPFDVDTFERVTRRVEREIISVPFRVGGE